jgi:hypothetical protein
MVVLIALVVAVVTTTRSNDHLRVAGHPKETAVDVLPRVDALVAMPSQATTEEVARVKGILDSTVVVQSYATLPRRVFAVLSIATNNMFGTPKVRSFARAHKDATILGVELDRSVAHGVQQLTSAVGSAATVKDFRDLNQRSDEVEIFMRVNACQAQIDAVRVALEQDPDIESFRFFSKEDSLNEFKKLFHDEPLLIENTTAEALPTSFRLQLRDGVLPWALADRYELLAGVAVAGTPANPFAKDTSDTPRNDDQSACAPNP